MGQSQKEGVLIEGNREQLGSLLDNKWIRYFGYDLKKCWKQIDAQKPIPEWDAMIAAHLLDSEPAASLDRIIQKYLNEGEPSGIRETYRAQKALEKVLKEKMDKEGVLDLFQNIEMPLLFVLHKMGAKRHFNRSQRGKKSIPRAGSGFKEAGSGNIPFCGRKV